MECNAGFRYVCAGHASFSMKMCGRDRGKVAFMRGPTVFCAEQVDNTNDLWKYLITREHCEGSAVNSTLICWWC